MRSELSPYAVNTGPVVPIPEAAVASSWLAAAWALLRWESCQ